MSADGVARADHVGLMEVEAVFQRLNGDEVGGGARSLRLDATRLLRGGSSPAVLVIEGRADDYLLAAQRTLSDPSRVDHAGVLQVLVMRVNHVARRLATLLGHSHRVQVATAELRPEMLKGGGWGVTVQARVIFSALASIAFVLGTVTLRRGQISLEPESGVIRCG
ncbi:MAG: hypothetical protein HYT76_06200 [Deltaproteobacteria bacterium]|nr:hypothetical protein [Deltaproteobacteria bacterium]